MMETKGRPRGNGSTNQLILYVCLFFSPSWLFFFVPRPPSAVEETRAAVTNLGFTIKLNSESRLATGVNK